MKIVHVLHEFPYPPTSGIRCDMWRRLEAFRALGHEVFAICWASAGAGEVPAPEMMVRLDAMTAEREVLIIGADPASRTRRVLNLRRYPSYIAGRIPRPSERTALIDRVRAFAPDLIWLEGVHASWLARELKSRLGVPLAYRSHNIEYRYVAEQARLAQSPRLKLALTAGTWGLEAAERALHADATRVFDISADDLAYWRGEGFTNNAWLATQPDPAILATAASPASARDIDLLFLGSLSSPNNVAGLRWFAEAVAPRIRAALPDLKLVIAGRNPPAEVVALAGTIGAELIANPADAAALFARARATINPILHGSGVNIKTVDMLATGRAVVTTTKGARGLPADVVAELAIADRPEGFAAAAVFSVRAARGGQAVGDRRALIERVFGIGAVAGALAPFAKEDA